MGLKFRMAKYRMQLGKHKGKEMYVAKSILSGRVSYQQFCEEVAEASTVQTADVKAVFDRAVRVIRRNAMLGRSVEVEDLGTFTPTFGSEPVDKAEDFNTRAHIRNVRLTFRAKPSFRSLGSVSVERLTNEEVVARDALRKRRTKGKTPAAPSTETTTPRSDTGGSGSGSFSGF